jgi:23S rRNA pseudouridine1911/1915/1917 synthase
MVVAKREEAYLALTNALRLRHVKRVYHAILWGDPGPDEGILDLPIGRDPKDRKRMAVVRGPSGKTARTRWRVLERYGLATLVECRLDPDARIGSACTWPRCDIRWWAIPCTVDGSERY